MIESKISQPTWTAFIACVELFFHALMLWFDDKWHSPLHFLPNTVLDVFHVFQVSVETRIDKAALILLVPFVDRRGIFVARCCCRNLRWKYVVENCRLQFWSNKKSAKIAPKSLRVYFYCYIFCRDSSKSYWNKMKKNSPNDSIMAPIVRSFFNYVSTEKWTLFLTWEFQFCSSNGLLILWRTNFFANFLFILLLSRKISFFCWRSWNNNAFCRSLSLFICCRLSALEPTCSATFNNISWNRVNLGS